MDQLIQYWRIYNGYLPFLITTVVCLSIAFLILFVYRLKNGNPIGARNKSLLEFGICFFLFLIGFITLCPTHLHERYIFDSTLKTGLLFRGDIESMINAALFFPLAFFLMLRFKARSFFLFVVATLCLSAMIETLQYYLPLGRVSAVNDVILNGFGAVIGWAAGAIIARRIGQRRLVEARSR
ncbi:VanZ family protein [Paenibacillus nanensis]|uniref:VanZ family protein n=1 Tax=Paenibacillus nanensis TaxID=393251 RepID=A0A3A1USJ5_9BACL|nr:VanZ family protein [Paenibacillus nanensis]RIX51205.1 VanZ family protein [Paenibacillus nanensis]